MGSGNPPVGAEQYWRKQLEDNVLIPLRDGTTVTVRVEQEIAHRALLDNAVVTYCTGVKRHLAIQHLGLGVYQISQAGPAENSTKIT